jgi:hypothetical protein
MVCAFGTIAGEELFLSMQLHKSTAAAFTGSERTNWAAAAAAAATAGRKEGRKEVSEWGEVHAVAVHQLRSTSFVLRLVSDGS